MSPEVSSLVRVRTFATPTTMMHGIGAVSALAKEARRLEMRRPLIVTDPGIVRSSLAVRVTEALDSAGMEYATFADVLANPTVELVGKGSAYYHSEGCAGLIAIGGGSSIDTAKSIGVGAS